MAGSKNAPPPPTPEDLAQQIETLRADLSRIAETMGELARLRAEEQAERLREARDHVGRMAEQEARRIYRQAGDAMEQADEMIRERPAMAVGIAAGLGFLVGLMMSARKGG